MTIDRDSSDSVVLTWKSGTSVRVIDLENIGKVVYVINNQGYRRAYQIPRQGEFRFGTLFITQEKEIELEDFPETLPCWCGGVLREKLTKGLRIVWRCDKCSSWCRPSDAEMETGMVTIVEMMEVNPCIIVHAESCCA